MKILSHSGCRIFKQGENQLFAKNFIGFATYARGNTISSKRRKGSPIKLTKPLELAAKQAS